MNLPTDKRNLSELFELFARTVTGPTDKPMGVAPEDTRESKYWEQDKQRNDERGWQYKDYSGKGC